MHNVITDNCKKIRPEYQPKTIRMSELKAVLEVTTTHLNLKLKDRVPSKGFRERQELDDIISVLQQNRLRWYGHVL